MANVVINGGQSSSNIRNVVLTITSPTRQFVYASEVAAPTLGAIGSNWIDTEGAGIFTLNFILSTGIGSKTVYVQFADDASGTSYTVAEAVYDSINLYENIRLPTITYPINGTEVTTRSIMVQGTADSGATVRIKVEAINA